MKRMIMAANWKMNLSIKEIDTYFSSIQEQLDVPWQSFLTNFDIYFAVPFPFLSHAKKLLAGSGVKIAAQNIHWKQSGAYTGEVSCSMLHSLGVSTALVGHSERRQYFNESDKSAAKKVRACLANEITPIFCIGEKIDDRQEGRTEEVLETQLQSLFEEVQEPKDLIVAYEPVWAIGTGLAASAEQADEAHKFIYNKLSQKYGVHDTRIIYGGSMKPQNTRELIDKQFIDGGLVGGASLKAESFAEMIKIMDFAYKT